MMSSTTLTTSSTTTDFTTLNPQFTTMIITKKAPLKWEEKMENARGCLLDYLTSRGKLQSISDWVQSTTDSIMGSTTIQSVVYLRTLEGTTAWTHPGARIVANQFNAFEYEHLHSVFLVIIYLL